MQCLNKSCEREFSSIRLAAYWPTAIPCKHCKTKHAFRFGHLIGAAFMCIAIPAAFVPLLIAPYFDRVVGQLYVAGPLHTLVHFGSLAIIMMALLFIQGTLLARLGHLRLR